MRTMKMTSKMLLDIVREERRNVQVLETKLETFNKEVEDEEYSRESKQVAVKAADTSREEKIEEVNELERERTPPRENQTAQHGKDYYTVQIADPQAAPADIRKAYRELALKGHPHKDPEGPAETAERSQEGGQTCAGEAEYKTKKGQSSGRMLKLSMIILAAMSLAYMTAGVWELTSSYRDWTTGI